MKIRHDIHTHTQISSCTHDVTATPENYVRTAAELGHKIIGISNHLWDESVMGASTWYHDQSFTHILPEKEILNRIDTCGVKVLFGAETEYCGMTDTLAIRAENTAPLDYILIPHTHTHMQGFVIPEIPEVIQFRAEYKKKLEKNFFWMSEKTLQKMANSLKMEDMLPHLDYSREKYERFVGDFMLESFEKLVANSEFKKLTQTLPVIIAHPFSPCESAESCVRIFDALDKRRLCNCFDTAVKMNVAFDINMCTFRFPNELDNDPMVKLMRLAKERGVKFTFGTDAHSVKSLSSIKLADAVSEAIGISHTDILDLVK